MTIMIAFTTQFTWWWEANGRWVMMQTNNNRYWSHLKDIAGYVAHNAVAFLSWWCSFSDIIRKSIWNVPIKEHLVNIRSNELVLNGELPSLKLFLHVTIINVFLNWLGSQNVNKQVMKGSWVERANIGQLNSTSEIALYTWPAKLCRIMIEEVQVEGRFWRFWWSQQRAVWPQVVL